MTHATQVYIVHRRDTLRASKIMQKRAMDNPKIEIVYDHVPVEARGADVLEAVTVGQPCRYRMTIAPGSINARSHEPDRFRMRVL